jgi:hypothetical protein
MELSANWKKLKATLQAEAPKRQTSKHFDHGTRILKRKHSPAAVSRPIKKPKIDRPGMEDEIATERVNDGLSERCVTRRLKSWVLSELLSASRLEDMLRLIVRWLVLDHSQIGNQHWPVSAL